MKASELERGTTRYVVVGPARSGTTVTHLALAGHPNVSALSDEVPVEPFFSQGISVFTHGNERAEERERGFLNLFDALASLNQGGRDIRALGLKTAISSYAEARAFCSSMRKHFPGALVVLTARRDIVAQFGSLLLARETGRWHSWVHAKKAVDRQLEIDGQDLLAHALDYLRVERELSGLKDSHHVIEVPFEECLLTDPGRAFRCLFHRIGLPEVEPSWLRSEKVAPPPSAFVADYASHVQAVERLRSRFDYDPDLCVEDLREVADGRLRGIVRRLRRLARFEPS